MLILWLIIQIAHWKELAWRVSVRYRSNRPDSSVCAIRATTVLVASCTILASWRRVRTAPRAIISPTARTNANARKVSKVKIASFLSGRLAFMKNLVSTTAPVPSEMRPVSFDWNGLQSSCFLSRDGCDCLPGYQGAQCESFNPCWNDPCPKEANCTVLLDSDEFQCVCPLGYRGTPDFDECLNLHNPHSPLIFTCLFLVPRAWLWRSH
jgi:hypothetical protein